MDIRTKRLVDAFNATGMTQTELCNKTGITKGALSSYLSGRYFPKQRALESLSRALNVSIPYLMGHEEQRVCSLSPLQVQLLSLFEDLNDVGQQKVIDYAADLVAGGRYQKNQGEIDISESV